MNATLLSRSPTTYVLVFETDDEVVLNLVTFATDHMLDTGHFTAIGGYLVDACVPAHPRSGHHQIAQTFAATNRRRDRSGSDSH